MNRIKHIQLPDKSAMDRAQKKWNSVAKPLHSLGMLEDMIIKIAGITGDENFSLDNRCVIAVCADNGVVCEGVSQSDSSVTSIVAKAMAEGTSNVNIMAACFGCDVLPVDMGMNETPDIQGLTVKKVRCGTGNIAETAAMTREEAEKTISAAMDMVKTQSEAGCRIIVTGEMGIGNTTTSSAITSFILDTAPENVTGRGAGLDSEGLIRKIDVIKRAIRTNSPDRNDPVDILAKLGGFDIAGMVGIFLGGAYYHVPVVIDGVISAAAAAIAYMTEPKAKNYMIASHVSKEPAGKMLLDFIGLEPPITAGLHLGEGTGGVLLLPMLDAALAVYNSSHSFANLEMEQYTEKE